MKILLSFTIALCKHKIGLCSFKRQASGYSSESVRRTFIDFFKVNHNHTFIPSSKVYSATDESLLFVNAGMNQFKPILLGNTASHADYGAVRRAVNSQRCIRVGGKHNDLDVVGSDCYHHTFFEMLGSWSFGDYFKKEACEMAWELLTQKFYLPVDNLYVTYFAGSKEMNLDPDLETKEIWLSIGVPENRIFPFGAKFNFWEMGDVGPCGPSTEIHYDQIGNRFVPEAINVDGSNVIEIWNLVFTQYNKIGPNHLELLDKFHVDTGMGLERITAILQGKLSNYDTDLFWPIIEKLENMSDCRPYKGKIGSADIDHIDTAYRIISDHIRMITIAIADGIIPGPKTRDLVLRKVLRRAVKVGIKHLHLPQMFMGELVPIVIDKLKDIHPNLSEKKHFIVSAVNAAEQEYFDLLAKGDAVIDKAVSKLSASDMHFPTETVIHLLSFLGYPKDRLLQKLSDCEKSFDNVAVDQFFIDKRSRDFQALQFDKNKRLQLDNVLLHAVSLLKLRKTEQVLTPHYDNANDTIVFNPIPVTVSAMLDDTGNAVEFKSIDINSHVFLLFDKTCFIHPQDQALPFVGEVRFSNGTVCSIDEVVNVQNWILHKISFKKSTDTSHKIFTGDLAYLCAVPNQWLPRLRSYDAGTMVKNALSKIDPDSVIHKIIYETDKLVVEISGTVSDRTLLKLENTVSDCISKSQTVSENQRLSASDVIAFAIVKHRQQGKSRTIIHCVTGFRAKQCVEVAENLKLAIKDVTEDYDAIANKSIDDLYILKKQVGCLNYKSNNSEYSAFIKSKNRNYLMSLHSKLNSLSRKKMKQKAAELQ